MIAFVCGGQEPHLGKKEKDQGESTEHKEGSSPLKENRLTRREDVKQRKPPSGKKERHGQVNGRTFSRRIWKVYRRFHSKSGQISIGKEGWETKDLLIRRQSEMFVATLGSRIALERK